jgi:hypothetical protein
VAGAEAGEAGIGAGAGVGANAEAGAVHCAAGPVDGAVEPVDGAADPVDGAADPVDGAADPDWVSARPAVELELSVLPHAWQLVCPLKISFAPQNWQVGLPASCPSVNSTLASGSAQELALAARQYDLTWWAKDRPERTVRGRYGWGGATAHVWRRRRAPVPRLAPPPGPGSTSGAAAVPRFHVWRRRRAGSPQFFPGFTPERHWAELAQEVLAGFTPNQHAARVAGRQSGTSASPASIRPRFGVGGAQDRPFSAGRGRFRAHRLSGGLPRVALV